MRYTVKWRNLKSGYDRWQMFKPECNRKDMISNRNYLRNLGHEVQVLIGETEIEVEDDDK